MWERGTPIPNSRAVDPHKFFADPDLAVLFTAVRIQLFFESGSGSSFTKFETNNLMKIFLTLKKTKKVQKKIMELVHINLNLFPMAPQDQ